VEALKLYASEHEGEVPTIWDFLKWARDPRIQARGIRAPRSHRPFGRFGGYKELLLAAGLHHAFSRGRRVPLKYRYENDELLAAVRRVADELGHAPREADYRDVYVQLLDEARGKDPPVDVIPAPSTLTHRFGAWPYVLEAAALPISEHTRKPRPSDVPRRRPPRYTDSELLEAVRRAHTAIGSPLTLRAYERWRKAELARADVANEYLVIPSVVPIRIRFGRWRVAVRAALRHDK
jgi:hypothetical protein